MQFNGSLHLGYSTNIHRGNTWEETFSSLQQAPLAVRQQACPADTPYGIGLRLSNTASEELAIETNLDALKRWLDQHNCYVFTINGSPYGGSSHRSLRLSCGQSLPRTLVRRPLCSPP